MKSYQTVVEERYNQAVEQRQNSVYAPLNPVGYYGGMSQRRLFYRIFNELKSQGLDIYKARILDLGCGMGGTTRMFLEFLGNADNISGTDLSDQRIAVAQKYNGSIRYAVTDMVQDAGEADHYSIITALDVFMHLGTEEEILSALENIRTMLRPGGYFIWYDAYAKDHFDVGEEDDHKGFHPRQMDALSTKAGFRLVQKYSLYRSILGRYNSVYLTKRFPFWMVRVLESMVPGPPGNVIRIYRKPE